MGFVLIHLHGEVHRVKAKLNGLDLPHEAARVDRDGHSMATTRVRGRIGVAR